MVWKKKLLKKELKHIKETTTSMTLREVRANINAQREFGIRCFDCERIARKLGL